MRVANKLGLLRADVLAATRDWELEYLSDTGCDQDLLLGMMSLATDVYAPVGTTDPDRHPVVLWANGVTDDDSISMIEETAIATKKMINNVEFIVVARANEADQLKSHAAERELPVTVVSVDEVEPLVDLIERAWVCVTLPTRDYPHGLAMLALSAGIPLISVGELAERHGFKNHLNYLGVEPGDHEAVAYGLQLLRRWSTWSLRIGVAGQKLVEERYSTRVVAIKEGEQLARIARNEDIESTTPNEANVLRAFLPPATGEVPAHLAGNSGASADEVEAELPEEQDQYLSAGFDRVAAALAEMSGSKPTTPVKAESGSGIP